MKIIATALPGVLIIEPRVFEDSRGYFLETWQSSRYDAIGLPAFVQDNLSFSGHGVLRGLHFQYPQAQSKLVSVLAGEVYDVAVDVRGGSPTFGKWVGVWLSAANKRQLFIPEGFAHGFCVTSDSALFHYKCSDYYSPATESGIIWNDPSLAIAWPLAEPVLSPKDGAYQRLAAIPPASLPPYGGEA